MTTSEQQFEAEDALRAAKITEKERTDSAPGSSDAVSAVAARGAAEHNATMARAKQREHHAIVRAAREETSANRRG